MARLRPPYGTSTALAHVLMLDGELAVDITEHRLRVGDGATLGGVKVARQDEVEALSESVDGEVTALSGALAEKASADDVAALEVRADQLEAAMTSGMIPVATWAEASALAGLTAGDGVKVYGPDAGTHTDPVTSETVANTGVFRYSASPAGLTRVADTEVEDAAALVAQATARISPFKASAAGTELERVHELSLRSADDEALYAGSYFLRYFARVGDALHCLVARTADNGVVSAVGLNGSSLSVAGKTGVQRFDLRQNLSNGVVGTVVVDLKDGSPFNASNVAWSTAAATLDNDRVIFANPHRSAAVEALAEPVARRAAAKQVFEPTVTDWRRDVVRDVRVEGALPGERFILNMEAFNHGGATGYRVIAQLYSLDRAANVATRSKAALTDWTEGRTEGFRLSGVIDGAFQSNYQGIDCWLDIDWEALAALGWNKSLTTSTTLEAGGLLASCNLSDDDLGEWLDRVRPEEVILVDQGGSTDFTGVQAAVESLYSDVLANIGKASYSVSDRLSASRPLEVRVIGDSQVNTLTHRDVTKSGTTTATGLVAPPGLVMVQPADAVTVMEAVESGAPPMYEANFTSLYRGGKDVQKGEGYIYHIDANANPKRAVSGPAILRQRHRVVIEDRWMEHWGATATAHSIGGGVSNGLEVVVRRGGVRRIGGGAAAHFLFHTVPDTTEPGTIIFEDWDFGVECAAVRFLKSHACPVRHRVIFRNCVGAAVECLINEGVGGDSAFVRVGPIDGFTSVSANLEP